ncbi:hypothetical protein B0A54_04691 [Friedmanniomyces endolithicus]|uniref:Amino acid permease/ SLC12A domain-containing protein n=1 Tax=Friedmanniomyces endolithicus TaxID=329885 RepID=A0A4U0V7E8_9PEZI|nr:hypothetical protein B0A54_04691 [Friedmanniomyces endolithicus]
MADRNASVYSTGGRKKSVAEEPVTSVLKGGDIPVNDSGREWTADEEVLAALGYKPEFKREFTLWTTFSVSFAVLGLLPSFATTLYYGMGYAGTAGMTWGWLVAMIGIQSVAASMAELCSSMPTSGGLYYASAVLAPPGWGPFAAWITGWSNWMGQVTGAPSVNYGTSAMILASASISNPNYTPTNYQTFLLTVLLQLIHGCMASLPTRWIGRVNSAGTTFNILALIALVVAYTVVDIPGALTSSLGQPFAAYLVQVLPQRLVLLVLSITIIAGFAMGQGCMIAASRVTFAYARDGCFPFSRYWKHVNTVTHTPVNAVWFNNAVGCCLLLLIFGGNLAIGAIFSIGALAAFVAFTTPIFIRLFFVGNRFRPGPWNLGKLSIPIGCIASAFVALMVPILCLPASTGDRLAWYTEDQWYVPRPPSHTIQRHLTTPQTLILIWWFVDARKWFKGPKINLDHLMLDREDQAAQLGGTIEGKDALGRSDSSDGDVPGEMPAGKQVGDMKPEGI